MKKYILILSTLIITACGTSNESSQELSDFPPEIILDDSSTTDMVGTIENTFDTSKNIIYAPTLALAWDLVKEYYKSVQIIEDKNSKDLMLLDKTLTHKNALEPKEYQTKITEDIDSVMFKASFTMDIIFKPQLQTISNPLLFNNEEVEAFGMEDWNKKIANNVHIIYYKNDDNFIFSLKAKDNELIFIKGLNSNEAQSFSQILNLLNDKKVIGNQERSNTTDAWKYEFKEGEILKVPILQFDITKNFNSIIGQSFSVDNIEHIISGASQRNALHLNHRGAKIKSVAEITEVAVDIDDVDESAIPLKYLILDTNFCLIIKHIHQQNPYFMLKVVNTNLMKKIN